MKRLAVAIFCVFFFGNLAFAQQAQAANPDPATREQIVRMIEVTDSRKQVKIMMDTMQQQVSAMIDQQLEKATPAPSPQMRAEMTAAMQDMMKGMEPLMDQMMDDMIPVYQKYLSRTEADAIMAFYLSPEGQSFLKKMPLIMGDAMPQMMKSMNTKMQPLLEQMAKRMEEITNKYKQQTPAPTGH